MRYLIQMRLTRYFNHKMIYKKTIFKRIEDSLVLVYSIFSFLQNIYLYISESLVCHSVYLVHLHRCLCGGKAFHPQRVRYQKWLLPQLRVKLGHR